MNFLNEKHPKFRFNNNENQVFASVRNSQGILHLAAEKQMPIRVFSRTK